MRVTEQDKIEVLKIARRDKIFVLGGDNGKIDGIVSVCIDEGLLESITPYTTRLTEKGKYYLDALDDLKTPRRQKPKYTAAITRKISFIKDIPNRYWQLLIAIMCLIVAIWALFSK